ncbi:hypothetical protein [Prevotella sp. KH2C16]|uniref:hypothetical protein n=1 Tax=Prevotella sp. KH2C16 TaxID=1855325 RepID=UPI0015A5533A|nr:hypothetical protein [Prevotella sp. KH2C16]
MMKEIEFISRLVEDNQYLTTEEEKGWYRSALYAALNWGHKIDREQEAYRMEQKRKSIIHRA